ncbi:MAG TPA: sigma factor, partial [Mycobacteriales bacterium]|nr:sigma factor [Mycobacteriales bacterium]
MSGADDLAALYVVHYPSLVRLAALLLDETAACEDVVQEAYIRLAASRRMERMRDPEAGLSYLRTTVLNLARSTLRRRMVATRYAPLVHRGDRVDDDAISTVER